jgi:hypothetical protein
MLYVAMLNFTQTSVINFILFERANENPWKTFIPYYGNFTQHKLTFGNKNKWFWFFNLLMPNGYNSYANYKWARAWGQSRGFSIFYLFLPLICGLLIIIQDKPLTPQKHFLNT